jgi:hypothetical protein
MTRLSVVIPGYEAEHAIGSALASVAAQTRQPDEVIVVDDGSSDSTSKAAQAWSACLPVHVIRLDENTGQGLGAGAARARGIDESSGDLIALLDADDYWLPEHLEVMLAQHDRLPGLVSGNYLMWVPGHSVGSTPATRLVPVPPPDEQRLAILSENFVFVSSLFSRRLYVEAGGFRNIRCEDWDLWIRMVRAGATVSTPDTVTVLYRQDPSSVSGTDKLLIGDIDLLSELLPTCADDERAVVEQALRRRRAKQLYLEGMQHAAAGHTDKARATWLEVIRTDPSLRRNRSKLNGQVALRAAAGMIAPRTMWRLREQRQHDAAFQVGDRRLNVTHGSSGGN